MKKYRNWGLPRVSPEKNISQSSFCHKEIRRKRGGGNFLGRGKEKPRIGINSHTKEKRRPWKKKAPCTTEAGR